MSADVVVRTSLPFPVFKQGKVRDVYDVGDRLLIVSTDRISAFDVVLPGGIPCKGEALTRLSVFWFRETRDIVPNHLVDVVDPRTLLVRKCRLVEVEFVVRGYLYGAAWDSYQRGLPVGGTRLPAGLQQAERLPEPLLAPTTKATTGHDLALTWAEVARRIGRALAAEIEERCLRIYERASRTAEAHGIIVADTKMEFGLLDDELVLIDELLTPDSSRFWPADAYVVGQEQPSFDKQYVRDYLVSSGWNREPPAPRLPAQVVRETAKRYVEAYERLTGRRF